MNIKKHLPHIAVIVATTMIALNEADAAPTVKWETVVNNGDLVPDTGKYFNAYNQPSVNKNGVVVIRARSKGPQRVSGIYTRKMKSPSKNPVTKVIDINNQVPQPNNNNVTFNETPSFPRMDRSSNSYAFRGMHQPAWTYTPDGGEETKIGTTGIYMQPKNQLLTGIDQLGVVPEFAYFAVPGETETLKFDMFPGAPSPVKNRVAFKGNYTVGTTGKTGVYFRDTKNDLKPTAKKPQLPAVKIANTDTIIPNGDQITKFGSTAPPSAAGNYMVFAGFDNEEAPTMGGLYRAKMVENAPLQTLAGIGDQVPGEGESDKFTRLSEGVSFDGRFVAFWGAWGTDMKKITLVCSDDGNKDRVAYCKANDNNKEVQVPVNQGFFVHDTKNGMTAMIARTGRDNFDDFVYWNYSGHPPSSSEPDEEGDAEPPRWRSSSFVAVDRINGRFRAAFKGSKTNEVTGIYLAEGPNQNLDAHYTVIDTQTPGVQIDPDVGTLNAISSTTDLMVSSVGIERDGLHGKWLALNAGMVNSDASVSWAGVYLAKLPSARLPVSTTP